jgi:predicted GNAT family N-acyltransferase
METAVNGTVVPFQASVSDDRDNDVATAAASPGRRLVRTKTLAESRAARSHATLLCVTRTIFGPGEHLLELERFRYDVCVRDKGLLLPHADHIGGRLADGDDAGAHHVLTYESTGPLVGCARVHVHPGVPQQAIADLHLEPFIRCYGEPFGYMSKLMVGRSTQGGGIAVALLQAAMSIDSPTRPCDEVLFTHCRPRMVRTYERLGLRRFGDVFEERDAGPQVPMFLLIGDVEHFVACRSPLSGTAAREPMASARKEMLLELLGSLRC